MSDTKPLIWKTKYYAGDEIQLKDHTFRVHILIENNRKEFEGEENTLKSVVECLRYVVRDKDAPDTRAVYMDMVYLKNLDGIYCVQVVVDDSIRPKDLVTAIASRKIPKTTGGIVYDSKRSSTSSI